MTASIENETWCLTGKQPLTDAYHSHLLCIPHPIRVGDCCTWRTPSWPCTVVTRHTCVTRRKISTREKGSGDEKTFKKTPSSITPFFKLLSIILYWIGNNGASIASSYWTWTFQTRYIKKGKGLSKEIDFYWISIIPSMIRDNSKGYKLSSYSEEEPLVKH